MTSAFHRVPLTALPNRAATQLKRFLFAYQLVDGGRFVIRHADPSNNKVEELEFDPRLDRFLSAKERLGLRAAAPNLLRLPSGHTAQASHRIDPDRNSLLVHYDVFASHNGEKVMEIEQEVYAPIPSEPIGAIAKALERARFSSDYAHWDEPRKVEHWASALHRLRRAKGESGRDEDEVFTPALLRDMERSDPNVRALLSRILHRLAGLGQVDSKQLEASFRQRVGVRGHPT
jgi:hypothetical protein